MDYSLIYTKSAEKDLAGLEPETAKRIIRKLDFYITQKDPLEYAKKLQGFEIDTYRFRIGDYRVIFRRDVKTNKLVILVVLKIAHRKEVY